MTEPDTPDIDRRIRAAFRDDDAAAARIAQAALVGEDVSARRVSRDATGDASRRRRQWAAVAAGAAALLAASAVVFWPVHPLPEPGAGAPVRQLLVGSIRDGALIVPLPDGSTSISWGAARDDRPPDGSGIVFVEGAVK